MRCVSSRLLHGGAAVLGGVHQLVRQAKRHGLLAAIARGLDHPAHRQCLAAGGAHFDRHLVGGAADAARLHFDHRLDVVERGRQHVDRLAALLAGLLGDAVERAVDDALGGGLLAALHDHVHELGQHLVVELRVRENGADRCLRIDATCVPLTSSGAWRRTSSGSACARRRRHSRACRARCGSARRADPSRGRRGSAPPSAPAGCGPRRRCSW